jgi:hypothetical protein
MSKYIYSHFCDECGTNEVDEAVIEYVKGLDPTELREHLILISQNPWLAKELREKIREFTDGT